MRETVLSPSQSYSDHQWTSSKCFTLPNMIDTVLQWALVGALFVTDNSFEITAAVFRIPSLAIPMGLAGIVLGRYHTAQ